METVAQCTKCHHIYADPGGDLVFYTCPSCGSSLERHVRERSGGAPVVGGLAGASVGGLAFGLPGAIIGAVLGAIIGAGQQHGRGAR